MLISCQFQNVQDQLCNSKNYWDWPSKKQARKSFQPTKCDILSTLIISIQWPERSIASVRGKVDKTQTNAHRLLFRVQAAFRSRLWTTRTRCYSLSIPSPIYSALTIFTFTVESRPIFKLQSSSWTFWNWQNVSTKMTHRLQESSNACSFYERKRPPDNFSSNSTLQITSSDLFYYTVFFYRIRKQPAKSFSISKKNLVSMIFFK